MAKYVPKPYELLGIDENTGDEIRLYDDGSKRNQKGHLLEYLGSGGELITQETARQYQQLRKQKILESIESTLKDVTKTNLPADAIAAIVGKRAKIAMTDDTRTGNEAAKIVLSAVDAYQDKVSSGTVNTQRHEYTIDDDTKRLLTAILHERRGYSDSDGVIDSDGDSRGDTEE